MATSSKVADVELGFVEKTSAWKLRSKFFPKKVGGKPSWLSLQNLPLEESLQCQNCKKPLVFLLQIYAPVDDCEEAFHRTLFLFMCSDGKCCNRSSNSNFAVFRSQLPRENIFFSSEPPVFVEEGSEVPSVEQYDPLCVICGCQAHMKCEHCLKINYCSQHHLQLDWEKDHKNTCNTETTAKNKKKKKKSCLLPEYELVDETEYLPDKAEEKSDAEKMKDYEAFLNSSDTGACMQSAQINEDELEGLVKKPDKAFNRFQKRIALEPEQVLRYQRGGVPLWVSSEHIPSKSDIPKCDCGAERIFEFQVLPQLLNYLSLDAVNDSVDWGTLVIYTCTKSCNIGNKYVKEFIWKQDFSDDTEKIK